MTSTYYIKDTSKFWQERKKARYALDKKRASVSMDEKRKIMMKLGSDADFLKCGRIVSKVHSI
jgi:hypothetical protein